jgi:hypothetical protein
VRYRNTIQSNSQISVRLQRLQVPQGVIGVTPRSHVRIRHIRFPAAKIIGQGGRQSSSHHGQLTVTGIISVIYTWPCRWGDVCRPSPDIAAGGGGISPGVGHPGI